jgi:hypothetical protein
MSQITQNVMGRVHTVYTIHKVKIIALKAMFIVGALGVVSSFVSFANVIENFKNTGGVSSFIISAFTSTELINQILFIVLIIFAYFSVKDLIDIVRTRRPLR